MTTSLLQQRVLQFLVHSFLYYQLGESLISDQKYDSLCGELNSMMQNSSKSTVPYIELVEQLGAEASGFTIRKYPPSIISTALHLIYQENYAKRITFSDFAARHGYRLELYSVTPTDNPVSS
ncbi:MAG: hypothetical protein HQM13_15535 [SAR324 cluster bacterium]|nr:hypothetical protein [SAR324 cluster bacterium]